MKEESPEICERYYKINRLLTNKTRSGLGSSRNNHQQNQTLPKVLNNDTSGQTPRDYVKKLNENPIFPPLSQSHFSNKYPGFHGGHCAGVPTMPFASIPIPLISYIQQHCINTDLIIQICFDHTPTSNVSKAKPKHWKPRVSITATQCEDRRPIFIISYPSRGNNCSSKEYKWLTNPRGERKMRTAQVKETS